MVYGPMQLVVIAFPNPDFPMELRKHLKSVRDQGLVRMIDAVYVSKDELADITVLEGSDLGEEETELLGIMAHAFFGYGLAGEAGVEIGVEARLEESGLGVFGLDDDDLLEIADSIPTGSAALFLLLEHVWALGLKEAVASSQGTVIANGWITPATLMAMGTEAASGFE